MLRTMGGLQVQQRTSDAFFNATEFIKQWNQWSQENKKLQKFLDLESVKEFIKALIDDIESEERAKMLSSQIIDNESVLINPKSGDLKLSDSQCVMEAIKVSVIKISKGKYGGTWMHPLLFIKFAMWLNPRFEVQVLKFVRDQMLHYRNEACESYKELSRAVATITSKDNMQEVMARVGKAINFILWNRHEDSERNKHATEPEMMRLHEYERHVATVINDGFITSSADLLSYLRRQWARKWQPAQTLSC